MQNNLPTSWTWAKLGDITNSINPGFPSGKHNKTGIGVAHLRPMNISYYGELDFSEVKYVDVDDCPKLKKGDILFNNTNSQELLGKTTTIAVDSDLTYSNHMTRLSINPEKANSNFIAKYLHFLFWKGYFKLNCSNHVNQASISKTLLSNIYIPLPPLPEQQLIVENIEELFSELDNGIALLKMAKEQLKTYRQTVLIHAFNGKLLEKTVVSVKLREVMKAAEPKVEYSRNQLPEGWRWVRLGEIGEVVRGASPRPAGSPKYFGGTIPWITVGEITKDKSKYLKSVSSFVTEEGKMKSRFVEKGTLMLTNSGATLGVPKILLIDGCFNDGSVAILKIGEPTKSYLYWFLKSKTEQLRKINQGAAQPNLNTKIVKDIIVPLCEMEIQLQIVAEIERLLSETDNLEKTLDESIQRAESLRQSILKQAFEGKLVKPQRKKNEKFEIIQMLGRVVYDLEQHQLYQGEMIIAKLFYLVIRFNQIQTYISFKKNNFGSYSPEIKKIINTNFFVRRGSGNNKYYTLLDKEKIFKYSNPSLSKIDNSFAALMEIFLKYKDPGQRNKKIELFATVCKIIEDDKITEVEGVYECMKNWKTDKKTTGFNNKAEKFNITETAKCLELIKAKGWDKIFINF